MGRPKIRLTVEVEVVERRQAGVKRGRSAEDATGNEDDEAANDVADELRQYETTFEIGYEVSANVSSARPGPGPTKKLGDNAKLRPGPIPSPSVFQPYLNLRDSGKRHSSRI
jgi:hypothetical protein